MKGVFLIVLIAVCSVMALNNKEEYPGCPCPRIYRPVCASNGRTFSNECEFRCFAKSVPRLHLRIVKEAECGEPANAVFE